MEKTTVPKATLGRLPQYLRFLKEQQREGAAYISATTIAKSLSLGDVQVRKDLNAVSGAGRPKVGYQTAGLIQSLEGVLGRDELTLAVLVGAGRLGRALLEYDEFEDYGVKIAAAFDCNEQTMYFNSTKEILPMSDFEAFCKTHNIRIGIITVGEGSAQQVCDLMLKSGITAIWNFAPCKLCVPEGVLIKQEKLALSLAHLNNQLCNLNQEANKWKERK